MKKETVSEKELLPYGVCFRLPGAFTIDLLIMDQLLMCEYIKYYR